MTCLWPTLAWSQGPPPAKSPGLSNNGTTLWLLETPTLESSVREDLKKGLGEALSGDRGRHIFGKKALAEYVRRAAPTPPGCVRGERACGTPGAMALDALELGLSIRVKVRRSSGQYEAAYQVTDQRGRPASVKIARGRTMRDLAFSLVRTIYDATGLVEITTKPPGARVLINGSDIGVTPLTRRLPIGRHLYTLSLENFQVIEKQLEVKPGDKTTVEHKLEKKPGMLVLEGAPPGSQLLVEGKPPFDATQPIELPAGNYTFEVKAQGFESFRDTIELEPGASVRRTVALARLNPLLRDISQAAIVDNRYWVRVGGEISGMDTTFRGARDNVEDVDLEFRRFLDAQGMSAGADETRPYGPLGLRLGLGYNWEYVGLTLLSVSILNDDHEETAQLEDLETGRSLVVTVKNVRQIQLRPAQLRARFFYKNLVPHAEAGVGFNLQSIDVETEPNLLRTLEQTEAFWTLGLGAEYFFSPRWYASLRYSFQSSFNVGVGTQHFLTLGVGVAFPNVFGFEPEPPGKL